MVKLGSHRSEPGDDGVGACWGLKMMGVSHVVFRGYDDGYDGASKSAFRHSDLMA